MKDNIETTNMESDVSEVKENKPSAVMSPFDQLQPSEDGDTSARGAVMGVPVTIEVVVGRSKLTVAELIDTQRGKVLELDRKAGDLVDITANGKVLARGELNIFDDGRIGVTFVETE